MHTPVQSIEIQGRASDGTPDPAKRLTLDQHGVEAMVAESWPTDNFPVLADSRLPSADRRTALVQMTIFGRYVYKCEPPFKVLKVEIQSYSNEGSNEIWTTQMCGTSTWNVALTNGRVIVSLLKKGS